MTRSCLSIGALLLAAGLGSAQPQFGFHTRPTGQPYMTPQQTVSRMKVADGFKVGVFAGEPMVINPIAFTVDERGRLWVVECFEYPKRTPPGKMPRDRIVILEDTDGDGVADKRTLFCEGKDFPERFDLASGIEVGHGGVFLGAPPYLWFIENKDDKPGRFEKLLTGFASQDTHETLNTFQWGPDGWLYGLHGVFTHSDVKAVDAEPGAPGIRMNAAIWRYHPRTRKFERWAEGTSNPWGWDFRNTDGEMILCCCVIPHLFHIAPGGIYKRQAGTSFNPYAYGYLNEICDHNFYQESGAAHAGLISLDTPLMPLEYRDSVIFGSIHGNSLKRNTLRRHGSTYVASKAPDFLTSQDKNVRLINLRWGTNGEIFLIDWHDQNPCHSAAPDSWDYERGRVYRIEPPGLPPKKSRDLGTLTMRQLIEAASDANPHVARTALRLLDERRDQLPTDFAEEIREKSRRIDILERLNLLDDAKTLRLLKEQGLVFTSQEPPPGGWSSLTRLRVARVLQSRDRLSPTIWKTVVEQAELEKNPVTRREFVSLAMKHPRESAARDVLRAIVAHDDTDDPVLPQLLWCALEPWVAIDPGAELAWLREKQPGNHLITDQLLPRAVRRVVAVNTPASLELAVSFVGGLTGPARTRGMEGLVASLQGRVVDQPPNWAAVRAKFDADPPSRPLLSKLAVSFRDREAGERALALIRDSARPAIERAEALPLAASLRSLEAAKACCAIVLTDGDLGLRRQAVRALADFDHGVVPDSLLAGWAKLSPELRSEAVNVLAGRRDWARKLVAAVADKKVAVGDLTTTVALRIHAHRDAKMSAEIDRLWGPVRQASTDMTKLIDEKRSVLGQGSASFTRGKKQFADHCGKCHTFEGVGHSVGPVLDGAGRDVESLLANILDPNRVVGAPYQLRRAILHAGRIEEGMLVAEDDASVTLKQENDQIKVLARKDIEELQVSEKSVMPEGLTKPMSDQDLRDVMRYLMNNPPLSAWMVDGRLVHLSLLGELTISASGSAVAEVSAPAPLNTKLVWRSNGPVRIFLNGSVIADAPAGESAVEIKLPSGRSEFRVEAPSGTRVAGRILDPDRRLSYPEP